MTARSRARGEGDLWGFAILAVLGLIGFGVYKGGQAIWREANGDGDDCYHYVGETRATQICLAPGTITNQTATCLSSWAGIEKFACFDSGGTGEGSVRAAQFVKDSGKRVCGEYRVTSDCSPIDPKTGLTQNETKELETLSLEEQGWAWLETHESDPRAAAVRAKLNRHREPHERVLSDQEAAALGLPITPK